jgi:hypothetical protein
VRGFAHHAKCVSSANENSAVDVHLSLHTDAGGGAAGTGESWVYTIPSLWQHYQHEMRCPRLAND